MRAREGAVPTDGTAPHLTASAALTAERGNVDVSAAHALIERLRPRSGGLFVVRFVKGRRGDVKHLYYRREHDAQGRAERLRDEGYEPVVFCTTILEWVAC